jgi:hypothetical protein
VGAAVDDGLTVVDDGRDVVDEGPPASDDRESAGRGAVTPVV